MSEATTVTEQPPFVPEEARLPLIVPATPVGMPPTAQAFFAVVSATGTLVRGFQAVSATNLGTGIYQVLFSHDITGSAYIGTIGLTGSSSDSPAGQIAVVGRAGENAIDPHGEESASRTTKATLPPHHNVFKYSSSAFFSGSDNCVP